MPELKPDTINQLFSVLKDAKFHQGRFIRHERSVWWDHRLPHNEIAASVNIRLADDAGFIYATTEEYDGPQIDLQGTSSTLGMKLNEVERELTRTIIQEMAGENIKVSVI